MILKKITKLTKNRDIGYASSGYIAEKVNIFLVIPVHLFSWQNLMQQQRHENRQSEHP